MTLKNQLSHQIGLLSVASEGYTVKTHGTQMMNFYLCATFSAIFLLILI